MYDNVLIKGVAYNFVAGKEKLYAMLRRRFPEAACQRPLDAFEKLFDFHTSQTYKESAAKFFVCKVPKVLAHPLLRPLRTLLQTKILGRHYYRSTQRTAEEMLDDCGVPRGSELAAVLLGQYGDSGMRPDKLSQMMHLGVMAHYSNGALYPVGGSGAIPRKLNAVVLAGGGRSFTQAHVDGLRMAADGQTCIGVTVNGVDVASKVVVSSIGAHRTYEKLVRTLPHPALSAAAAAAMGRIEKTTELTVAFIFLFLGLDVSGQPEEERDERSHNTWIYPSTEYTAMEKAIEADAPWSHPMPVFVASGSAKDAKWPSTFGKGKKTVVVLSQCPWAWVEPWAHLSHAEREKDGGYRAFKQRTQAELMEQGFRKVFPHLEKYIVHSSVGTPLTTNGFLGTSQGECYGRSASPSRWLCPDLSPYTPVPNLLLTGQDVVTLGLTGAIASGYLTANVLAGYGCWENILLQREIVDDLGLGKIF